MANLRVDKITSTETFETTGSVQFDGTTDFLSLSSSTDFAMGTGDFTAECWVYVVNHTHVEGGYGQRIFDSNTGQLGIYINSDGTGGYVGALVSGTDIRPTVAHGIAPEDTWTHAAICRSGDDFRIFVNGREAAYRSGTGSVASSADFRIGARASGEGGFKGHISNLRVIKGKALYTSNFKPPMRELEVVPGTVLLACQSKTDASLEKTGKNITVNGNAVASELTPGILTPVPKAGAGSAITGSVEFDGSGDYLKISNATDFDLGADDFTIEYWYNEGNDARTERRTLYMRDSAQQFIVGHTNDNSGRIFFQAFDSSGNTVSGSAVTSADASNPTGKRNYWRHLAVVRNGTTATIYLDGVASGSRSFGTTAIRGDQNDLYIGQDPASSGREFRGFISNLRIVKGTALYTDDFIPPTRELKKVPGTVLLCCQDPDDPLTEATGKTITGYGSLQREDGVELITNGTFDSDVSNWTATDCTLTYSSGQMQITRSGGAGLTANQAFTTVAGNKYNLSGTINSSGSRGDLRVYNGSGTGGSMIVTLSGTSGAVTDLRGTFVASSTTSTVVIAIDNNSTSVTVDNISVTLAEGSNKGSNFTPQVGDDRKVTLEGVTKVNSDAYFYLPTGDTASRETTGTYNAGTRGLYSSWQTPDTSTYDTIEYLTIATLGSVNDFGNLTNQKYNQIACSSNTRGLFASGYTVSPASGNNFIDYVTIMSTGNAEEFGDLSYITYVPDACSNQIRGIWAGGAAAPNYAGLDNIDYVTISSLGNGTNFGDLTDARHSLTGLASPTRGVFGAGQTNVNTMDYITIASTGDAKDFGDLLLGRAGCAGASSAIRGLFAGGYTATPNVNNIIEFITIASMGNSQDFGDLTAVRRFAGATSSTTRGVFIAGYNPSATNTIDFVSIQTTGNATDFGDTTINKTQADACSNGHGGLG